MFLEACINLFFISSAVLSKVSRAFLRSAHQNLEICIMIQSLQEKGIFLLHAWVEWRSLRLKLSSVWAPRLNTNKEWIIFGLLCMLCPALTLNYGAKYFPSPSLFHLQASLLLCSLRDGAHFSSSKIMQKASPGFLSAIPTVLKILQG